MTSRQPVLFEPLEDIEFWDSRADLVTQHDGEVFVWNPETSHIHIFYHRDLSPSTQLLSQELLLTQVPSFKISRICISPKGQRLLLWGDKGLAVVEIPKRRRPKGTTSCRCTIIGARFFLGHSAVSIVDTKWHPASLDDNHLLVLTSDNVLRVYKREEPECAVNSYPIFDTENLLPYLSCLNVSTGPSLLSAKFGKMVSFSVGGALDHKEGEEAMFPVYVLEENSDIYVLHISIYNEKYKSELKGPLKVVPVDEDTPDVCSILCLPCTPPVLVVATQSATLQHLALLHDDQLEEECLYQLETVELELPAVAAEDDISTQSTDDVDKLVLLQDPVARDRYFVRHSTGVHSIHLPAVARLEHFVKDESGELNLECECVAEHMLCVQPIGAGDPTCLFGSVVILDPMLGSYLLVLISNAEFISLPLRAIHRETIPLLSRGGGGKGSEPGSPMKELQSGKFSNEIQRILARTVSNPLLRCGESKKLSQKSLLELLMKSTQVFREEYVAKQSRARHELLHRMSLLQEQHTQHKTDISELISTLETLARQGTNLNERSQKISKRQQILCQRVNTIMRDTQTLLPSLSTAEVSFKEEIRQMSHNLKSLHQDADQLREKLKFQTKSASEIPVLSASQQDRVKSILRENDKRINGLVSKIKSATAQIQT